MLHLHRPLKGGLDAPEASDEMEEGMLRKILGLLRAFPEHEATFLELDRAAEEIIELVRSDPSCVSRPDSLSFCAGLSGMEKFTFPSTGVLVEHRVRAYVFFPSSFDLLPRTPLCFYSLNPLSQLSR